VLKLKPEHYTGHRQHVLEECARRGIVVTPKGEAWQVQGKGVDMLVSDIGMLTLGDLDAKSAISR
jgi:predicted TIM-barrel enzyme